MRVQKIKLGWQSLPLLLFSWMKNKISSEEEDYAEELKTIIENTANPRLRVLLEQYTEKSNVTPLPSQLVTLEDSFIKQHQIYVNTLANVGLTLDELPPTSSLEKEVILLTKRMNEDNQRRNNRFYCPGEKEAIEEYEKSKKNNILTFSCAFTRNFDADADQIHYRVVKSMFERMSLIYNYNYGINSIKSVDYIVNPMLIKRFEDKRREFAERYDMLLESVKPLLLFHGTKTTNIPFITKDNFSIAKLGAHTGNRGAYGAGIYFSCYPHYSLGYCQGGKSMLACLVIAGRAHLGGSLGVDLTQGYDSHTSPDGCSEVVIYNADQILPCYVIHFE